VRGGGGPGGDGGKGERVEVGQATQEAGELAEGPDTREVILAARSTIQPTTEAINPTSVRTD
jgi:hypothetical protein